MTHRDGGRAAEQTVAIGGTGDINGLAAVMASVENDPKRTAVPEPISLITNL
jgi:hypothetical protein